MIQRLQTVYLLLAAVCLILHVIVGVSVPYVWILTLLMAAGSLVAVFLYNHRPVQANVCVCLIGVGLVYYLIMAVFQHRLNGMMEFSWPMALPAVAMLFWFMARKGIVHDEKLVRSLDRIR